MASTRLTDRVIAHALRLPAPSTGYGVSEGLRVPMRDGAELIADHYRPHTASPRGTVLVRGPYGRSLPFALIYARIYAARGYHVLLQSVRGTFGSGGTFVPMVHEVDDAADTVAWLREQPWFTGTFATIGLSYLGFTQWALLSDPPPELAAAVISIGPHDLYTSTWGSGAFALGDFLGWADMMAHQEQGPLKRASYQLSATRRMRRAVRDVPLGEAGRALLGGRSPWYESWLAHPERDDPFWSPMRMTAALDRATVPVLLLTGWQDVFLDQTVDQFGHLRRRGVDVAMTIGPWTHDGMATRGTAVTATETLSWLDRHLAAKDGGLHLAGELHAFVAAVVHVHVVRLGAEGVALVGVEQDDVRVAADADGAFAREHAKDLRRVGGGDFYELVHADALLVHAFAEEQFHAVLDGGVTVRDL